MSYFADTAKNLRRMASAAALYRATIGELPTYSKRLHPVNGAYEHLKHAAELGEIAKAAQQLKRHHEQQAEACIDVGMRRINGENLA